jgi:chromosome segregation ATPase
VRIGHACRCTQILITEWCDGSANEKGWCQPIEPSQDRLAQLQASIADGRQRLEAQAAGSAAAARQLEEAREGLRSARSGAEEAVAEAEDARNECGRVLRELASVHEVGGAGR